MQGAPVWGGLWEATQGAQALKNFTYGASVSCCASNLVPMNISKLTVKQAADHLGISKDTILRAIAKGELPAELDLGSTGSQYWLDLTSVEEWRKNRKRRMRRRTDAIPTSAVPESILPTQEPQASDALHESHSSLKAPLASPESLASVPVEAHLAALDLVKTLHSQLTEVQHQVAEERRQREQAERTRMALEWQMHQYRTALSEQAESLAESQAMRRVAEAKLEATVTEPPEDPHLERLKLGKSERKSWGQRLRGWLGIQQAKV